MTKVGRRRFVMAAGELLALPHARAQEKMRRIGYLVMSPLTEVPSPERAALIEGLRALGYVEGRNLVPPPRAHLTRFHGIFAPNAKLRAQLTPSGRGKRRPSNATEDTPPEPADPRTPAERRLSMTWAQRLKRVFGIDVNTCIHCGGERLEFGVHQRVRLVLVAVVHPRRSLKLPYSSIAL